MDITRGSGVIRRTVNTITFDGSAGAGEAGTNVSVFTVTGRVLVHLVAGFCTTDLTEASATATVSLGTTNQTTRFIAATNSTDIDENEWWVSTTPTAGSIDSPDAVGAVLVSEDVVIAPAAQNTNGGVLEVYCLWEPLSSGASLVAA